MKTEYCIEKCIRCKIKHNMCMIYNFSIKSKIYQSIHTVRLYDLRYKTYLEYGLYLIKALFLRNHDCTSFHLFCPCNYSKMMPENEFIWLR